MMEVKKHYKGEDTAESESRRIQKGDRLLIEKVEADEQVVEGISSCGNYVKIKHDWVKLNTLKVLAVVKAEEADGE